MKLLTGAGEGEEVPSNRFTALAMGFETLMTILTEGICSAFRDEPGVNGGPAALPAHPVETGVPISYRRATSDFEMAGNEVKVGDLLRLQLQVLGYVTREEDRKWIFGVGPHSCVGKRASMRIWTELKMAFDPPRLRGHIVSYELVPSHYLLRHNSVHVEVFLMNREEAKSKLLDVLLSMDLISAVERTAAVESGANDIELGGLGIDSMAVVDLCMNFEERTGRELRVESATIRKTHALSISRTMA